MMCDTQGDARQRSENPAPVRGKFPHGCTCVFSCSETLARSLFNKDAAGLCTVFIKLNDYFHCIHSPRSSLWLAFRLYRNNRKLPSDINKFRL